MSSPDCRDGGARTHTVRILSPMPLPIGLRPLARLHDFDPAIPIQITYQVSRECPNRGLHFAHSKAIYDVFSFDHKILGDGVGQYLPGLNSHSTRPGSRTQTVWFLKPLPLPLG